MLANAQELVYTFQDLISVYNGNRGLHIVVLYLVVGKWRIPWSFRVWRGKGTPSQVSLVLLDIERLNSLVRDCGFDIHFDRCKM